MWFSVKFHSFSNTIPPGAFRRELSSPSTRITDEQKFNLLTVRLLLVPAPIFPFLLRWPHDPREAAFEPAAVLINSQRQPLEARLPRGKVWGKILWKEAANEMSGVIPSVAGRLIDYSLKPRRQPFLLFENIMQSGCRGPKPLRRFMW